MATLIIPTPLRKFTNSKGIYEAPASSIKDLLEKLVSDFEGIKPHLFDGDNNLRSFIRIYLGDEDIHELDGVGTSLSDKDEVSIIPAIAGGSK